nr:uncharacterized protein LOC109178468 [Ipomoea batatas]
MVSEHVVMGDQSLADSVTAIRGDIRAIKATLEPSPKPVTNLISEHFVKGDQSLADTVTALRGDVRAIKATLEAMKSDQNELFQMFRQLMTADGRSIEEYNHEFKSILMRINTVSQDQEVRLYLAGLDDWLRFDLKSGRPASLGKAIGLALSVCRRCTVCPP